MKKSPHKWELYRNGRGYSTVGWFTRGTQGEITLREFSSPVPGKARFQEGPEKRTPCNLPQVSTGGCEVDYRGGVRAVTKREEGEKSKLAKRKRRRDRPTHSASRKAPAAFGRTTSRSAPPRAFQLAPGASPKCLFDADRQFGKTFGRRELHKGLRPLALRSSSLQPAGVRSGVGTPHSTHVLGYRSSIEKSLRATPIVACNCPHTQEKANFKTAPQEKKNRVPERQKPRAV